MSAMLLEVERLSKSFGGVQAVQDVSFGVAKGEMVAVIGPNGAGKTTLFNMISGVIPPTGGSVRFQGGVINGKKPHELAMLGMTRTFQNLQLFSDMTVLENVMVGFHTRLTGGIFSAGFRLPLARREEKQAQEQAFSCLEQIGLAHLAWERAGTLPYGTQRLVEIARAAVSRPSLILLDEPMAGLNPQESKQLVDVLLAMREQGFTFLFVEHDMETVMAIADRIVVLDYGKKIAEGAPEEIARHPDVIKAYLGEEAV
ncbi:MULTISPECIES: ABC transporter ATP-binding protein [Geobacillus]|uniref:ABC transporter ATP-binding protein n=1 Tax=Geobacillus thermocatenulatus TaxID=33938 RepID=A0A226QAV3_9BACL|nr:MULTISPECIES: ABC transporter ATP-binding protein [Geobacillus]ASS98289.1 high-affinity branched-chain amino acid ABC transporter ATP-binding protein LivG [Geobacillus thermocatenulatus]KLR74330.1 leucine/isoleucine/valine transporter ATP-binding subunit [Geobacillus sp. T6]OXB89048.1 ABC transporter ATP-binding protein [Geobacillus thermocatenulatus]RAN22370.1 leucine/isoleucine/valine transporter ATP-binding subunit [Geobacillus sp. A8]